MPASKRQMPTKESISEYWGYHKDICWRCEVSHMTLERAHIVDRYQWQEDAHLLDIEENIWLLCKPCHSVQPTFKVDEYVNALAWMSLDAKVYAELFANEPYMVSLRESDETMFETAFNTVVNLLQSLWDDGLTSRGFHTLV